MALDEIIQFLIYVSIYLGLFVTILYIISYFLTDPPIFKKIKRRNLPKVSIIVPAWNEEKGIGPTIKSLLKIDYPRDKFEIIVVDDGSTDNTFINAKKYASKIVKVYRKKINGGKYTAMNYAIKRSNGEIIFSTDADNLEVSPDAVLYMVRYFENPNVMCVAPTMAISNPKGILARVQQVEYLLGVFLRRTFSNIQSMHVTPGAFSAYRKSFFKKYGLFKRAHLTEDMEMALRIQKHNYLIENSIDAVVYTKAVKKFIPLLRQRRRWYVGLIRNLIDYKMLFSPKHGIMAIVVLPMAVWAIFTTIVFTTYVVIRTLINAQKQFLLYNSVNYDVFYFNFNEYTILRSFLNFATTPLIVFTFIFIIILVGYMVFSQRWVKEHSKIKLSIVYFLVFYSLLSAIWYADALIHSFILYKRLKWR